MSDTPVISPLHMDRDTPLGNVPSTSHPGKRALVVEGDFNANVVPSGLLNGGLITEVTLNDSTWTALPITPQTNRNAISIQNYSGFEIKINYATPGGYIGMVIPDRSERYYDIKDTIVLYGKFASGGTGSVNVEEIS